MKRKTKEEIKIIQNIIVSFYRQLFYMSVIATIIGCFILVFRKIINQKLEPRCNYIIWVVFIIVLIFPVAIPSKFSIYNFIDMSKIKKENVYYFEDALSLATDANEIETYYNMKSGISDNNHKNKTYFGKIMVDILLVVTILKLSMAMYKYSKLKLEIRNQEIEDERINKILKECKESLKIKRKIKIVKQRNIKVPSIFGMFDVKILITDTTLLLNNSELKSIFMHELSHYKRKDIVMNWLITIIKAFHWFNPMISVLFVYMKMDIELATDALALSRMKDIKETEYCNVLIKLAGLNHIKMEQILSFISYKEKLHNRLDAVLRKKKFEKYSIFMFVGTIFILLFMLLFLYPTSYGSLDVPKLYLQLENGEKIDISEKDEIYLANGSKLKLIVEGENDKKYIWYTKYNSNTESYYFQTIIVGTEIDFDSGENYYRFILNYSNGKNVSYDVKILVE